MRPITKPVDVIKDSKRLSNCIYEMLDHINLILKACQAQSRLVANELIARPTYAEEFMNLRNNLHMLHGHNGDEGQEDPKPATSEPVSDNESMESERVSECDEPQAAAAKESEPIFQSRKKNGGGLT